MFYVLRVLGNCNLNSFKGTKNGVVSVYSNLVKSFHLQIFSFVLYTLTIHRVTKVS